MFVLDTDHIVILQRGRGEELRRLLERMDRHPPVRFFYPVVAFHEQMLGAHTYLARAKTPRELVRGYAMLYQILADFSSAQVLPFDEAAALKFEQLRGHRLRVGTMDLRIASIALSRGMAVLTRNRTDYQAIPGLDVDDWTAASR